MNPNYVFLLSLIIILIGHVIKRLKIITEKNGKIIARIILNVTLPALIFLVINNIEIRIALIILPFICLGYSASLAFIAFLIFRKRPNEKKGLILMTAIGYNIGLFAYPLIEMIWGPEGLVYVIMFDIGNSFVIFGLSYSLGLIFSPKYNLKQKKFEFKPIVIKLLTSIPLMALLVALTLKLLTISLPLFALDLLAVLSRANMALTLLLLGIYLNFNIDRKYWKTIFEVITIRYAFGLSAGIIFYFLLPYDKFFNAAILVAFVLPIGMSAIAFASEFEYDEELISMIVNLTSMISFGLMWLIVILLGIG
ncbi:MAG: AEC family transporter [Promethearchaeota archaeon]|nr:MAG: AEC family transporter [Candidatus Lokiarchaeota archaeon]